MIASVESGTSTNQQGLAFFTKSATATATDSVLERLRIDDQGRVGIGTTSPQQLLHLEAGEASRLRLQRTGASPSICDVGNLGNLLTLSQNVSGISFETGSTPTERARIDSSGRLLVGASTSITNAGSASPALQVHGTTGSPAASSQTRWSNDNGGPIYFLSKSRGTSIGTRGSVISGDQAGRLRFTADDGTNFVDAAFVTAEVDGTPATGVMPGRLVFSTTPGASGTPTERMRITSAGVLQVADAGNISVGTTTGTKIGTATTQKLGFFNATPVVQPTAVADATDAATAISQLNALLAHMRTLGLIAT
jgi:hypothetical protein